MEELVLLEAIGAVDVVLLEGIACHLLLLDRVHRERVELDEFVKVHHAVAVCVGQHKVVLQKVLLLLGIPSRRYLSKLPEDIEELHLVDGAAAVLVVRFERRRSYRLDVLRLIAARLGLRQERIEFVFAQ